MNNVQLSVCTILRWRPMLFVVDSCRHLWWNIVNFRLSRNKMAARVIFYKTHGAIYVEKLSTTICYIQKWLPMSFAIGSWRHLWCNAFNWQLSRNKMAAHVIIVHRLMTPSMMENFQLCRFHHTKMAAHVICHSHGPMAPSMMTYFQLPFVPFKNGDPVLFTA